MADRTSTLLDYDADATKILWSGVMDRKNDDPYREIVNWVLMESLDEREPPEVEGLAQGGRYWTSHDDGEWLVGWEEVSSSSPVGTYVIGRGSSFAEVKAIAERDYALRRQKAGRPQSPQR